MPANKRKIPFFRRIAPALWNNPQDPSVYGFIELDISDLNNKSLLLPVLIKSVAETISLHPELSQMVKWGQIFNRQEKGLTVMVNIPERKDLSALYVPLNRCENIKLIENLLEEKIKKIRDYQDPHLGHALEFLGTSPWFFIRFFLKIYSLLTYELGLPIPLKFLPYRPFGSVILSNVGSLGIQKALLPLVPLSRATMMISIGEWSEEVKYHNNQISVRQIINLGVTFDHRILDGSHAGHMLQDFKKSFYQHIRHY